MAHSRTGIVQDIQCAIDWITDSSFVFMVTNGRRYCLLLLAHAHGWAVVPSTALCSGTIARNGGPKPHRGVHFEFR